VGGFSSHGGFCGPAVKPIALNMVSELYNHPDFKLPISGIGGIETWQDAAEFLLMGSSSVQICTAVMHYGYRIIDDLTQGLSDYLDENKLCQVTDLTGIAARKLRKWEELDLNYKVIAHINPEKCIGCQLCYIACEDGAHQSIALQEHTRVPVIKEDHCVGCNLCSLVCPVDECISMVKIETGQEKLTWPYHPANPHRKLEPV
jgi:dihydropyrimidine dehydrogenase (NAD+) subunit PreA